MKDPFIMATAREGMLLERQRVLQLLKRFYIEDSKVRPGGRLLRYAAQAIRQGEHHRGMEGR